jgi:hypothetical protein
MRIYPIKDPRTLEPGDTLIQEENRSLWEVLDVTAEAVKMRSKHKATDELREPHRTVQNEFQHAEHADVTSLACDRARFAHSVTPWWWKRAVGGLRARAVEVAFRHGEVVTVYADASQLRVEVCSGAEAGTARDAEAVDLVRKLIEDVGGDIVPDGGD